MFRDKGQWKIPLVPHPSTLHMSLRKQVIFRRDLHETVMGAAKCFPVPLAVSDETVGFHTTLKNHQCVLKTVIQIIHNHIFTPFLLNIFFSCLTNLQERQSHCSLWNLYLILFWTGHKPALSGLCDSPCVPHGAFTRCATWGTPLTKWSLCRRL